MSGIEPSPSLDESQHQQQSQAPPKTKTETETKKRLRLPGQSGSAVNKKRKKLPGYRPGKPLTSTSTSNSNSTVRTATLPNKIENQNSIQNGLLNGSNLATTFSSGSGSMTAPSSTSPPTLSQSSVNKKPKSAKYDRFVREDLYARFEIEADRDRQTMKLKSLSSSALLHDTGTKNNGAKNEGGGEERGRKSFSFSIQKIVWKQEINVRVTKGSCLCEIYILVETLNPYKLLAV